MDNLYYDLHDPFVIAAIVFVILGILAAFIIVKIMRNRAEEYLNNLPGAAVVLLSRKRLESESSWAENNKIIDIDGEKANCFTYKVIMRACYIAFGTHVITVKSSWGGKDRKRGYYIKSTPPQKLTVKIKPYGHYSLEYNRSTGQFVFEEYENERLFPKRKQTADSQFANEEWTADSQFASEEQTASSQFANGEQTTSSQFASEEQATSSQFADEEQIISPQEYDDASWHYDGDYPDDLPDENGVTHIGMFFQWCIENDLLSEEMEEEFLEDFIEPVKAHTMTGAEALWEWLDGQLISDCLNNEGNGFAMAYYESDTDFGNSYASYLSDYEDVMKKKTAETGIKYETLYHFENTYENYLLLKPVIDERFKQWKAFSKSRS